MKERIISDRRNYQRRIFDIPTLPERRSGKERRTEIDRRS